MKYIGGFAFPETPEEAKEWRAYTHFIALHSQVLCVANTRIEGAWKAYCGPVAGINHHEEYEDVLKNGNQLSKDIAEVMFLGFKDVPYAR